jgi:hypothetical protein
MRGAIPPLPQYAVMAWCLVKAQGQLYLYLINQVSCHEEVWGCTVIVHSFLSSALDGGEWSASRTFYPRGKRAQYPLDRRLTDSQRQCGSGGEKKKIPALDGNRNWVVRSIAQSLY